MSNTDYQIVDPVALDRIHAASLSILQGTGMEIADQEALSRLADAGCEVSLDDQRVRFPPALIEEKLKMVPASVQLGGQIAENDLVIGDGSQSIATRPIVGVEDILDHRTGELRRATVNDLKEWITLNDALPNIDYNGDLCPVDVHLPSRDVIAAAIACRYTKKHLHAFSHSGTSVDLIARIAEVIARNEDAPPPISTFSVAISPLFLPKVSVGRIVAAGNHKMPVFLNSSPQMGATSPVTVAGTVALMNAEVLAMIALSQVFNPGAVVIYTARPFILDMRSAASTFGYMETTLANTLTAQMVKQKYGIPLDIVAPSTDAKIVDEQSAMERTWSSILPLLAGAEFAIGLGNIENTGTNSFTQLVMDDELFASIKRMLDGISVDDDSLALEVIAEVGPKGNYLGASHTVKNYRSATRPSDIFDHANRGTWEKAGAPALLVKIEQKIEHILANHQVESLSDDQIAALDEIITEAEATLTTAEG